ncbi:SAM-dependent methyltransferase [Nocardioides sp. BE266]|uniref:methyltransferase domain-containing protein n=1 Tax=Nocardioides sp. BE266 TaxID=2817725 RepID=UPI0028568651|nr:methyltransferase domain-containing protein [Nocardioides sp. BE266]MDR7255328.1 SAM-dependent methyltransferase [Nocardioides sp. BE266]
MTHEGTTSVDYGRDYYNEAHLGGHGDYSWDNEEWRTFFTRMAERLLAVAPAATVLDVGCARGLLVHAFLLQGVDATGIDVSEHAVASAHEDVRDRLSVASATEPIEGRYDLITCIEVLEHMEASAAHDAIDAMTAATDRIVFSSTPSDLDEPTHINVHDTREWAAWFADRGFYRRTDVDLSFITSWAILFERAEPSSRELVDRYETVLNRYVTETVAKREALLASQREVSRLGQEVDGGDAKLQEALREARHDLLVNRDQFIGTEAEIGRVNRDLTRMAQELRSTSRKLTRTTQKRDELQKRLARVNERSEQQVQRLRRRVADLEGELAAARTSFPRRVARAVRRRLG